MAEVVTSSANSDCFDQSFSTLIGSLANAPSINVRQHL